MPPRQPVGASGAPEDSDAHSARKARDEAFQQQLRAAREDLARRAAIPASLDPDEALRAAQARATAAADEPLGSMGTAIGNALPRKIRDKARLEVVNPKIWEADIKPLRGRKPDFNAFRARIKRASREGGDVLKTAIKAVGEAIMRFTRAQGMGFARRSFSRLAKEADCCVDTAVKAVRFLERHCGLDTFNVLSRRHGQVRREANMYIIPAEPPNSNESAEDALSGRLNRWAPAFGLRARPWGLNATPARVGYRPPMERRPAPS